MNERLNEKHVTFYELLKNATEKEDPVAYIKGQMTKDRRILAILGYAFNPQFKMPLPDGIPPYIPSQHPIGIAPVEILNLHNKLYVMYNKDAKQYKKEEMIVRWMEDMAPEEAELMIHIKDQTLDEAFEKLPLSIFLDVLGWDPKKYISAKTSAKAPIARP